MFSFISRAVNTRIDPTSWDPSHAVPVGSSSFTQTFKSTISSASTVILAPGGAWSHGTVEFRVQENAEPPTYDAAVNVMTALDSKKRGPQLADGEGFLEVNVEARWNDEELWKEAEVELRKVGQHNAELVIKTPSMSASRLASQLSFHVTFLFPPHISGLTGLRTSGAQWRTIGHGSLSAIHLSNLSISTANASIAFANTHATTASLATVNNSITGEYHASIIRAHTDNGAVEGKFYALEPENGTGSSRGAGSDAGSCEIHTTNNKIKATVRARTMKLYNRNGPIKGDYIAQDRIEIDNTNGVVSGEFSAGEGGTKVTTGNGPIEGTFKVRRSLYAKTSNGKIDIKVILVGMEDLSRSSTPDLFDDVKQPDGPGVVKRTNGKIDLEVVTSNGSVVVEVIEHPEGIELDAKAKTSNASATIKHLAPCDAFFNLSTSNASANLTVPYNHTITYSHESKNKCEGQFQSKDGPKSVNKFEAKSSNAPVSIIIE
ncbi:hypothetical protein P7C70_g6858, partial [Phenoliferia sp. Uapishka_3]